MEEKKCCCCSEKQTMQFRGTKKGIAEPPETHRRSGAWYTGNDRKGMPTAMIF